MINTDTITGPSFSLKNRLCRFVWNCSSLLFFYYSPIPFHGWRRFVLRCFGAKVANGVHVYPGVKIWAPWNLSLDSECGIAKGVILYNQAPIHIGRRAVISQEAFLCSGTHDYQVPGFPLRAYPIHVGAHAWVAAQAFIHPGVTIGEGCVIGARSVVTRSMPEWMVCAGHPCQPIKERNRW